MPAPKGPSAGTPTAEELDELGVPNVTPNDEEEVVEDPPTDEEVEEISSEEGGSEDDEEMSEVALSDLADMDADDLKAIAEASNITLPAEAVTSEDILAVITEAAATPPPAKKEGASATPGSVSPELAALTAQVAALTSLVTTQQKAPLAPPAPPKPATQDYVGEIDVTELTKEGLNALLNNVATQATQASLTQVPGVAANMAQQEIQQNILIESYFNANPSLNTDIGRQTVGQTMNTLITRNPVLTTKQALEQAGKEVIKAFGLTNALKPKVKSGRGSGRKVRSHQGGGKGVRLVQPKKKTTKLQDELDELKVPSAI